MTQTLRPLVLGLAGLLLASVAAQAQESTVKLGVIRYTTKE